MERATVFAVALFVVFYVYVLYLILSLAFLFPQQERYQREESQRAYARGAAVSAAVAVGDGHLGRRVVFSVRRHGGDRGLTNGEGFHVAFIVHRGDFLIAAVPVYGLIRGPFRRDGGGEFAACSNPEIHLFGGERYPAQRAAGRDIDSQGERHRIDRGGEAIIEVRRVEVSRYAEGGGCLLYTSPSPRDCS